ncbi:MAG: prepilin-type N-terminal cleavage/methylation domain-containing protein [Hyphomonadaceae bacterium]|nr:prepilin-type N-terminal cleavage/methylation domain-containing protein [Clostridia bacterium]
MKTIKWFLRQGIGKLSNSHGMSLIEMMIAFLILGIIVAPLISMFIFSIKADQVTLTTTRANAVANQWMEDSKADKELTVSGNNGADFEALDTTEGFAVSRRVSLVAPQVPLDGTSVTPVPVYSPMPENRVQLIIAAPNPPGLQLKARAFYALIDDYNNFVQDDFSGETARNIYIYRNKTQIYNGGTQLGTDITGLRTDFYIEVNSLLTLPYTLSVYNYTGNPIRISKYNDAQLLKIDPQAGIVNLSNTINSTSEEQTSSTYKIEIKVVAIQNPQNTVTLEGEAVQYR